jgi:hypothetical protein
VSSRYSPAKPVLLERAGAAGEGLGLLLAERQRVAAVRGIKAVDLLRFDQAADQGVVVPGDGPEQLRALAAVGLDRDAVGVRHAAQEEPALRPLAPEASTSRSTSATLHPREARK